MSRVRICKKTDYISQLFSPENLLLHTWNRNVDACKTKTNINTPVYLYVSFGWPVLQGGVIDTHGTGMFNSPGLRNSMYRGAYMPACSLQNKILFFIFLV